jgi:cytochrome c553
MSFSCNRVTVRRGAAALLGACALAFMGLPAAAQTGEAIYKQKCASCHGAKGEGTAKFSEHLTGDRAVPELAEVIRRTMPENKPGSLTPAEAQKIAAYIHDAFYSRAAHERLYPPRVELARLTVRQYRNVVADLIAGFRPGPTAGEKRGLKAEYFKSRRFNGNDRVADRVDNAVNFDFGTGVPIETKAEYREFSIRWTGSVTAPETGEYEFVVRSEHSVQLWVNDLRKPLVNAWVRSGDDNEHKATIFLLGGRTYSLRLEFSKSKQGVDDTKKQKAPPPAVKASVALAWKPPKQAADVIPAVRLSPVQPPETFVLGTPFPPDDRSYGWERGTTISKEWDAAATEAALETVGYIIPRLNELSGTRDGAPDRAAKVRAFCRTFAERAFRRPLTPEQEKIFIARRFDNAADVDLAAKQSLILVLKSPRFLYREVGGAADGFDAAARLSFTLWDSLPDGVLLTAAGGLTDKAAIAKQAERMLNDPRCRTKLREFLLTWLNVHHGPDLAKNPMRFPGFDAAVASDLRLSLELFLDDVVWSETSDFRRLLLADNLFLNGRLAKFYGAEVPADAGFASVKLDPAKRAGVITHPYLMAAFSYTGETSPIHRGVFLMRGVLGRALRPPPEAFTPLPAELHPSLTTRERVALQTKETACISCHGVINPLGFSLEHFDAVGRYREKDNAKPVNSAGAFTTRDGKTAAFTGARELAEFLAKSEEVQEAFVEQLFHFLVQQSVKAYGRDTLTKLRQSFAANNFNIRKLVVEVAATAALPPKPAGR